MRPLATRVEELEDTESSGTEVLTARARWTAPRLLAGALALAAAIALAVATLRPGAALPRSSGLESLIAKAEASGASVPECVPYATACAGCKEGECAACNATVQLKCCIANAGSADSRKACCDDTKADKADVAEVCVKTVPEKKCSEAGKGCKDTGCCENKNLTCFVKNSHWADCKAACKPGEVDKNSKEEDQAPWSCLVPGQCAPDHLNCKLFPAGCCDHGKKCYVKNQWWAGCRTSCKAGRPYEHDPSKEPWNCTIVETA
mmetsp:Transcript_78738/g.238809  ORF Transcript_78738/g.238809 Transcript_78738/m.238809 type:complete len:262 (-) Transcript_78738:232-1017(-)